MVKTAEEKLRQERANLWRAKALNRQLLGDEAWMPLSVVESPDDWDLFEPRPSNAAGPASKMRKLNGEINGAQVDDAAIEDVGGVMNGVDGGKSTAGPSNSDATADESAHDQKDTEMSEAPAAEQSTEEVALQEPVINGDVDALITESKDRADANDMNRSEDTLPAGDSTLR